MQSKLKIAVIGRRKDAANYERFLSENSFIPVTTLTPAQVLSCDGLLLPGGGDITPAFFGRHNRGSQNIDTELDILQFQALELCLGRKMPVLGICKGMQLINVAFGGTLLQDMPLASMHRFQGADQYHPTFIGQNNLLFDLYGGQAFVNSAHHQCVERPGKNLRIVQWSVPDKCPEALVHETLPVLGLQWHPERLDPQLTKTSGASVLSLFRLRPSSSPIFSHCTTLPPD